jgi:hypothetical protein
VPLFEKDVPEVVPRHGLAGIDLQRPPEERCPLLQAPVLGEDRSKVGERVRVPRKELDRGAKVRGRLGLSAAQEEGGSDGPVASAEKPRKLFARRTAGSNSP